MAESNVISLTLKAKDEASLAITKLHEAMKSTAAIEESTNAKLRSLRTQANEFTAKLTNDRIALAELEKEKNLSTLYGYYKAGLISAEQYSASVKAINKQAMEAAAGPSLFEKIKQNWLALSASIIAIWGTVSQAIQYIDIGAKALQSEESFKQVTAAFGIEGDKLLAKMKEVSAGMIDESDLMQRAVKALQQGLNPDQIVALLEVARSSARIAGIDVAAAFDRITEAAANQQVRGLKALGIVIDQSKAFEDYANKIGIAKDALNEQQQSQALANAAIEEGQRQLLKMGPLLVNEAEQIQITKRAFSELKEEIGKELILILQLVMEHVDSLGVALAAAGIVAAPAAIKAIVSSLQSLTGAAGTASMAMKTVSAALIVTAAYEGIIALTKWIIGYEETMKRAETANKNLAATASETALKLSAKGFTGDVETMIAQMHKAANEGILVFDKLAGGSKNLQEVLRQNIQIIEAQIKALQATSNFHVALIKEDYDTGKITLEQYIAFVKTSQDKITENQIIAAQKRIEETKNEYSIKKISADEMKTKIAVIEQEIVVLRQNAITGYYNFEKGAREEAAKNREAAQKEELEEAKKEQQKEFDNWAVLQELKLNTMKANIELQTALDDVAVKAGVMRESTALQNRLDRTQAFYKEQLRIAEETAWKQAESYGWDSAEYKKALTDKENLQMKYQQAAISSEAAIAEMKKTEQMEAEEYISKLLKDRTRQDEVEKAKQIEELNKFFAKGLISYQDYYDALDVIEEQYTSEFKRELQERTAQLNRAIEIITERRMKLQEAISGFYQESFDDINRFFGGATKALKTNLSDMEAQITQFMNKTTWVSADTFWNATLFGRRMVDMVGTTIYEWTQRVSDYIIRVKQLMADLQGTIDNYRLQLMQLRGDRLGELDAWLKEEKKKLEEKYKDDLSKTKEYYEAMALLDELYKEKKKKILDDMKNDAETAQAAPPDTGSYAAAAAGYAGSLYQQIAPPALPAQGTTTEQTTYGTFIFNIPAPEQDREGTRRWLRDTFMPEFEDILKNRGIAL